MGGLFKGMTGGQALGYGQNMLGMGLETMFKQQAMDIEKQKMDLTKMLQTAQMKIEKEKLDVQKERLEIDKKEADILNLLHESQAEGVKQETATRGKLLDIAMPSGRRPVTPEGKAIQRTPEDKIKRMLPLLTALKGNLPTGMKMGQENYGSAWGFLGATPGQQQAFAGVKPAAGDIGKFLSVGKEELANYPAEYMTAVEKSLKTKNLGHVNAVQKKYGMNQIKKLDDINQSLSDALDNLEIGGNLTKAGLPFVINRDKPGSVFTQPQMGITKDIIAKYGNDAILMFAKLKSLMEDTDRFFHVPVPEFYRIYNAILKARKNGLSDQKILSDAGELGYDTDLIKEMLKLK